MTVHTPRFAMLADLAKETTSEGRRELLRRVTEALDPAAPLAADEVAAFDDVLATIASDYSTQVRAQIARLVASSLSPFSRSAQRFAMDDIEVARPDPGTFRSPDRRHLAAGGRPEIPGSHDGGDPAAPDQRGGFAGPGRARRRRGGDFASDQPASRNRLRSLWHGRQARGNQPRAAGASGAAVRRADRIAERSLHEGRSGSAPRDRRQIRIRAAGRIGSRLPAQPDARLQPLYPAGRFRAFQAPHRRHAAQGRTDRRPRLCR